jgi:uncharacterized membrane protein
MTPDLWLEALLLLASLALALWFRPWQMLRRAELQSPWLAALVILPWVWSAQKWLPGGLVLHLSGACLLVLMFGWPLAVCTLVPVALTGAWLEQSGHGLNWSAYWPADWPALLSEALVQAVWYGIAPATIALGFGLATRRWLPRHLFVYILARGFLGTVLSITLAGVLAVAWRGAPQGIDPTEMLLGRWLMGWGEAFATGMFTAIFVAFRPEWLATYSDERYLPTDRHDHHPNDRRAP